MDSTDLATLAHDHIETAKSAPSGRSSVALHPGRHYRLRQTLIALAAEHKLDEHDAPSEATLFVLSGRVRLAAGDDVWEGGPGELLVIPDHRHDLLAIDDAAVLLTTVVDAGR